jgi:hypothetical protein
MASSAPDPGPTWTWDHRTGLEIAASGDQIGSDTVEPQPKGANMKGRIWDGKAVQAGMADGRWDSPESVQVFLTPQAARMVALSLGRLKQAHGTLPGEAQELLTALDYVMVGDPTSTRAAKQMEAGKGMTPDGGYKAPEKRSPITGEDISDKRRYS